MMPSGYAADWPAPSTVKTWQTLRRGGVSSGSYAELNLGLHVGDDPGAVAVNRARLRESLSLPAEPLWLDQVHGTRILRVDRDESGAADGAVTAASGRVLVVMTADCLPVMLTTKQGDMIGIAHAGWRGLAGGVLEAAVDALAVSATDVLAWFGPAISQDAFEVGDEVFAAFVGKEPAAAEHFSRNDNERWQADLFGLARQALARAGVDQVFGDERCTFGNAFDFYSHRREAPCGRMASLIWLDAANRR